MRNVNLLKSLVSEICVKQIRINQGVGVIGNINVDYFFKMGISVKCLLILVVINLV